MEKRSGVANPYEGLSAEEALEKMRQLKAQETSNQVQMGLLYNYLVDSKKLEGTKYKSALDFICQNIQDISKSALLMYGLVARMFSQGVCAVFGISRLYLLVTYQKLTKIELNAEEPGTTLILVPDQNGEVKPKLFADCSVEEMRQALGHQRRQNVKPVPEEERAIVDRFRGSVESAFPKSKVVRVQQRNHEGHAMVDIKGVLALELATLAEALLDHLSEATGGAQDKPEKKVA